MSNPTALLALLLVAASGLAHGEDTPRKICMADAKRLCPAAIKAASRHQAEVCLAAQIDKTSPACHAVIDKVKAEREKAGAPHP